MWRLRPFSSVSVLVRKVKSLVLKMGGLQSLIWGQSGVVVVPVLIQLVRVEVGGELRCIGGVGGEVGRQQKRPQTPRVVP